MADGGGKSWLKYGCLGCLGVIALLVLVLVSLGGIAWQRSKGIETREQVLTRDLASESDPALRPGVSPESLRADMPDAFQREEAWAESGKVILDLSQAGFFIEPARPGEPMRVEAEFDETRYRLEEKLTTDDEGRFTYAVTFQPRGSSSFLDGIAELIGGKQRVVRIYLPRDVPISLEINCKQGGTHADLGGLWLTDARVESSMGGMDLRFSEPLRAPMRSLAFSGGIGGWAVQDLGNASPGAMSVAFSMGGLALDLGGEWKTDSRIAIAATMSGAKVRLPRDVNIEGVESMEASAGLEGAPTLTFDVDKSESEIEFRR